MNLIEFIDGELKNSYIHEDNIDVYVRKSKRVIEGSFVEYLDIANVLVSEEYWNQGIFTDFMKRAINTKLNIYVECIHNPAVEHVCKKLEFEYFIKSEFECSMYKIK